MAALKFYKYSVIMHVAGGTTIGMYYGSNMGQDNYAKHKELTPIETLGEIFCYSTIIMAGGFLGGCSGVLWGLFGPIYVPIALYYQYFNNPQIKNISEDTLITNDKIESDSLNIEDELEMR